MTTHEAVDELVNAAFRQFGGVGDAGAVVIHHKDTEDTKKNDHTIRNSYSEKRRCRRDANGTGYRGSRRANL